MIINYVPPELIYPCSAKAFPQEQKILIRNDIAGVYLRFVKSHEIYHLRDKTKSVFCRELKANMYAARKYPLGFLIAIGRAIWHFKQMIEYIKWRWRRNNGLERGRQ